MTTTTILHVSRDTPGRDAAGDALRNAGLGVVEVEGWDAARDALRRSEAALVMCDGEALAMLADGRKPPGGGVPREVARSLSHDLRTPLSAMVGWLHLMESGKLDEAGMKRAMEKLRGNIDDQVRTIERYLGASQEGQG
jgi:signal transduction histidine kinase